MPAGVYERGEFSLRQFFELRVKSGDGCWEWTGARYSSGYGECRRRLAHRVSFELNVRYLLKDEQVLHVCDNRKCVNPSHLYAGSDADNRRDAIERKRYPGGAKSSRAKLSEKQVIEMKARAAEMGHPISREKVSQILSGDYGVTRFAVRDILSGRRWGHVQLRKEN